MRIVGLLSWYDEPCEWLSECVTRISPAIDHLVAVDGPYAQFPGAQAKPSSPAEQAKAISAAAEESSIEITLDCPGRPWASEVAKRDHMFRVAESLGADWLFRIDADEFADVPDDLRDRLAATELHVATASLWDHEHEHSVPLRVLFRALPGLTISHSHSLVTCVIDDRRLLLAGDPGTYDLEPAEHIPELRLEHRSVDRDSARQAGKKAYYQIMRRIETVMPQREGEIGQMKIRIKIPVTGLRNGVRWPPVGGTIELPDLEAARMCERGYADPVAEREEPEKAVVSDDSEKRATPKKRPGRPRKQEDTDKAD